MLNSIQFIGEKYFPLIIEDRSYFHKFLKSQILNFLLVLDTYGFTYNIKLQFILILKLPKSRIRNLYARSNLDLTFYYSRRCTYGRRIDRWLSSSSDERIESHGRNGRMWPAIMHFSRLEDTLHVAREFKDPVEKPAVYAGKQAWVSHSSK